jgi:hypothetical protein
MAQPSVPAYYRLAEELDTPLGRRAFTPTTVVALERLWDKREAFLSKIEHLPQTFCHNDAFRQIFLQTWGRMDSCEP